MQDFTKIENKEDKLPFLPNDVLLVIFSFVNVKDLYIGISLSCKQWRNLVNSGRVFLEPTWKNRTAEPVFSKYRSKGRECFDNERWEEAVKHFSHALLFNPKDHLSYFWRAYSYAESGKFIPALADFTRSLEIDPQDATTYSNRGATYRDIGEHDKALKDLEEAIRLDPNSASAYNNRGVVYGDLGKLEDAVREYSKALEIDPSHLIAMRNRGRRYQKMGKLDEAHADFTKLLQLDSKDNEALRFFIGCEIKGIFGFSRPKLLPQI